MFFRLTTNKFLILLLLVLACESGYAKENCQSQIKDEQCTEVNRWSFGLTTGFGMRTNPIVGRNQIPLIILPSFSYYGENVFIENLDIGYTLFESESNSDTDSQSSLASGFNQWQINLLITPSYDRVFFESWDVGNILVNLPSSAAQSAALPIDSQQTTDNLTEIANYDLRKRKYSFLGGIEASNQYAKNQFQLSILQDISGVHSGKEIRFAWARPLFDQQWQGTLGFTWKDKSMTDYYYGVKPQEIIDDRAAYQAGSSFNPFVRISWKQKQQKDFWKAGVEFQKLDKQISNSPIVDKDNVVTFFIGKQFNF